MLGVNNDGTLCEPKLVWAEEIEPNIYDEQYNCDVCEHKECEFWEEFNSKEA